MQSIELRVPAANIPTDPELERALFFAEKDLTEWTTLVTQAAAPELHYVWTSRQVGGKQSAEMPG